VASELLNRLMDNGVLRIVARRSANWIDLQWSMIDSLLKSVAPRTHGRLLDVGCGQKEHAPIFLPYVDEYVGLEHEATFGETQASQQSSKPDFFYDGVTMPFPAASFDTLLNVSVLEHTPEPLRLLREMSRVLKPGGLLILSAPFSFRLHEEPHDYFRYTPHGLRSMLTEVGLEVEEIRPQGDLWSVVGHKLNSFLAFRVARMGSVAQAMGKLGHEGVATHGPRFWTLPVVVPAMGTISAAARVLDRFAPDGTETLSFLVLARKPGVSARPKG
jgi:SAM-dependent methyltransferase